MAPPRHIRADTTSQGVGRWLTAQRPVSWPRDRPAAQGSLAGCASAAAAATAPNACRRSHGEGSTHAPTRPAPICRDPRAECPTDRGTDLTGRGRVPAPSAHHRLDHSAGRGPKPRERRRGAVVRVDLPCPHLGAVAGELLRRLAAMSPAQVASMSRGIRSKVPLLPGVEGFRLKMSFPRPGIGCSRSNTSIACRPASRPASAAQAGVQDGAPMPAATHVPRATA